MHDWTEVTSDPNSLPEECKIVQAHGYSEQNTGGVVFYGFHCKGIWFQAMDQHMAHPLGKPEVKVTHWKIMKNFWVAPDDFPEELLIKPIPDSYANSMETAPKDVEILVKLKNGQFDLVGWCSCEYNDWTDQYGKIVKSEPIKWWKLPDEK
jgi:hypothetical protein